MRIIMPEAQEKLSGVYRITNTITNKIYIGSTIIGFRKRLSSHLFLLNKGNHHSKHLQRSFNKYGSNNFMFEIIDICTTDKIIEREQYWLDYYKPYLRKNGYNILQKSHNSLGHKHTEESLILISECSKRRPINRNAIEAMRKSNIGRKKDNSHSIMMSNIHSIPIVQLSLNGDFMREWHSATEACKVLELRNPTNISRCCLKKCKSYGGFQWIKKSEYNSKTDYKYNPIINGKR